MVVTSFCIFLCPCDIELSGIHMQWGIVMGIYMSIGKQSIAHSVYKEALSGTGLTRFKILFSP